MDFHTGRANSADPMDASLKRCSAHVYSRRSKQCCALHYCLRRVAKKKTKKKINKKKKTKKNETPIFFICNVFLRGNLLDFHYTECLYGTYWHIGLYT